MKIEVITTKKNLSKSVVRQLSPASLGDMNQFVNMKENGFYVRDLGGRFATKVAIFKGINEWVIMDIRDWSPYGEFGIEVKDGRDLRAFHSKEVRDMWIESYNKAKALCLKNHLIL